MTPRQADLLTAVGLAALLAAIALTSPRWSALLRASTAVSDPEDPGAGAAIAPEPAGMVEPARRINVRLYFEAPDRDGLLPEERDVEFSADLPRQLRTVVEELAKGSGQGLLATLPPGTRVNDVFVLAHGVACVSLSGELAAGLPGGSRAELLTVYSIVNTIVTNFPSVSRVQLVVNDQLANTLAGHIDLTRPLPPDMTLVAVDPPAAPPSPGAASSPSPSSSPSTP